MFNLLNIVLVETRFPENIGAVARASANFGSAPISLVNPEMWEIEKAKPLATKQGIMLLENIQVYKTLDKAITESTLCIGTSARLGGVRREVLTPKECAKEIFRYLSKGEKVSLIFGPEDRGLENHHLELCQKLVTIPTAPQCSSLNLAQAVVLILYELFDIIPQKQKTRKKDKGAISRRITSEERILLHNKIKQVLIDIDVIQKDNPDYFFIPMARFLDKKEIRRHEMDMLLGICRQVERLGKNK